jgi:hypothetical protein
MSARHESLDATLELIAELMESARADGLRWAATPTVMRWVEALEAQGAFGGRDPVEALRTVLDVETPAEAEMVAA